LVLPKQLARTAHGKTIKIDAKNENDNLRSACSISFFAKSDAIAGTNAVQKAAFIANGKWINVSTLESSPANLIASCSKASLLVNIPSYAV
jgi:hypothetical protein